MLNDRHALAERMRIDGPFETSSKSDKLTRELGFMTDNDVISLL
jgi:hypothetical protein